MCRALPYPSTKKTLGSRGSLGNLDPRDPSIHGFPQCMDPREARSSGRSRRCQIWLEPAHHGRHAAAYRRKGARRDASNQTWQRAWGPGDARPTPRVLSRGSPGAPRDRDLTIHASGHAGERRALAAFSIPRHARTYQSAACRARAPHPFQILSARACVERLSPRCTMHMRGSCSARMYCSRMSGRARRVRKGNGQDLQLALVPEVSRVPSTLVHNSWLHCYLRMCIPYRSNMPADTALASRTPVA